MKLNTLKLPCMGEVYIVREFSYINELLKKRLTKLSELSSITILIDVRRSSVMLSLAWPWHLGYMWNKVKSELSFAPDDSKCEGQKKYGPEVSPDSQTYIN